MRKNIFDRIQELGHNTENEMDKIYKIFKEKCFQFNANNTAMSTTLEEAVDVFQLHLWKQRRTATTLHELKTLLGILQTENKIAYPSENKMLNLDEVIIYLEYILNIVMLAFEVRSRIHVEQKFCKYYVRLEESGVLMLLENIDILLDNMNYQRKTNDKEERVIIVEKNAAVTAVSEIVDDELFWPTIEYNHHLLRDNVERKREILLKFADKIEPLREELRGLHKNTETNLFFLFNSLNIRHNNSDSTNRKHYIEYVANLSSKQLEEWYDETYQLVLYSFLLLDNSSRIKRVDELKKTIEQAKGKS